MPQSHLITFPLQCPKCHAAAGHPFMASTTKGNSEGIRLGVRCRTCQAEWSVEFRTESGHLYALDSPADKPDGVEPS